MTGRVGLRIACVLITLTATPALAQPAHPTTFSLSAYGEVRAAPDMAEITLGVTTEADTAAEAMRQNAQQMTRMVAALRQQGLADRDIQTSGLSLNPQYVYAQNQPPKLTGYRASNQVRVAVQDVAKLGAAIDAVTAAGANQINGIRFSLKNPQAVEDEARREAVKALTAKAEIYAQATGYHIARLVSLGEDAAQSEGPRPNEVVVTAARLAPTPVEAGELNVRVDISGTYELTK